MLPVRCGHGSYLLNAGVVTEVKMPEEICRECGEVISGLPCPVCDPNNPRLTGSRCIECGANAVHYGECLCCNEEKFGRVPDCESLEAWNKASKYE